MPGDAHDCPSSLALTGLAFLLLITWSGCLYPAGDYHLAEEHQASGYENRFTVPGQSIRHPDVYSLQLFRRGSENSAPVIQLNSGDQLVLRFDMLESETRQFRIRVTHHNPDWSRSPLPPEEFTKGFTQAFFGGGTPSASTRPSYRSYEYQLPNEDLDFAASGNYLLHLEEFETGRPLFSLPFFIHENEGQITSSSDRYPGTGRDLRDRIVPNSTYIYPDFVEMPGFDLQFQFIQNRFWGRAETAREFDTATPGSVYYELSQNRAFIENNQFRGLNLARLDAMGSFIRDFRPDRVPPEVILDVDTEGLGMRLQSPAGSRFGHPRTGPDARYGDIHFRFTPRHPPGRNGKLYLTGDFNNWIIDEELALTQNPEAQYWEVNTFVKEGRYTYSYVLVEGNRVLDLLPGEVFSPTRQEVTTFVYYRDPARHHYRLLQANTFLSD